MFKIVWPSSSKSWAAAGFERLCHLLSLRVGQRHRASKLCVHQMPCA